MCLKHEHITPEAAGILGEVIEERLHNRVLHEQHCHIPKSDIKKHILKSLNLDKKIKIKPKSEI